MTDCLDHVVTLAAMESARSTGRPVAACGADLLPELELSVDMLTDALRAAGLVKADAIPQLATPPLRDGNGWAVTLDLPRGGGRPPLMRSPNATPLPLNSAWMRSKSSCPASAPRLEAMPDG